MQLCVARSRELLVINFQIYILNFLTFTFVGGSAPRTLRFARGSQAAIWVVFETLRGYNFLNFKWFLKVFQKLFLVTQITTVSSFRPFRQNVFFAP